MAEETETPVGGFDWSEERGRAQGNSTPTSADDVGGCIWSKTNKLAQTESAPTPNSRRDPEGARRGVSAEPARVSDRNPRRRTASPEDAPETAEFVNVILERRARNSDLHRYIVGLADGLQPLSEAERSRQIVRELQRLDGEAQSRPMPGSLAARLDVRARSVSLDLPMSATIPMRDFWPKGSEPASFHVSDEQLSMLISSLQR